MSATVDTLEAFGEMQELFGVTGDYARGDDTASLTLIKQMATYTIDNGDGIFETASVIDWMVELSDIATLFTVPKYGDRITHGAKVYEVLGRRGLPPFDNSDADGLVIKVHTAEVAA